MEIKKENKFKRFFKRYGALAVAGVFVAGIVLAVAFAVTSISTNVNDPSEDVSGGIMKFGLPMEDAVVVKDFAEDRLQYNSTLKRWEIHLALDLTSTKQDVFSVYDGVVASVKNDGSEGCTITVNHDNGFVSVYSSLSEETNVSEGDKIKKGDKIGTAAATAVNELADGGHLHFTMLLNGKEVDPNNYLDLQNK